MTVILTCLAPDCGVQRTYRLSALSVSLYTHGVCTVKFFCLSCKEQSEQPLPDALAIDLDRRGATTTIVHTPGEILEWPRLDVPPLTEHDAGIFERSTLAHFQDCFRRELVDMLDDNARSEGS